MNAGIFPSENIYERLCRVCLVSVIGCRSEGWEIPVCDCSSCGESSVALGAT